MTTNFISDTETLKLAKHYLPNDEYAVFSHHLERMRHFEDCLTTNTPSPYCKYADPVENLNWCRLGLRISSTSFEHVMGEVLSRHHADATGGTAA
jgi:hypothetical protein